MSDLITSSASAFSGKYAEAIAEQAELFKNLNEIVNAIPNIVSALPKGKTIEDVLTADPGSALLFSSFWGNINLSDEQRAYINGISTDLFSKQKYAREKQTKSPCCLWPGDGNQYEQDLYITNHYGEKILAPRIWLFLSLSNCHGSFDSVGLVKTYFLPWLIAIQEFILKHYFNKTDTSQKNICTYASSTLLKMLSELETDIQDETILDSQKTKKIKELETLITNLFTKFENMFLIHDKMENAVSIGKFFKKNIYRQMFDNHKTIFDKQHKMFITIRDIINTQLKYPHSEIKFAFIASRPPSHNLLLRHNACRFNDEPNEPDEPGESSMMSID